MSQWTTSVTSWTSDAELRDSALASITQVTSERATAISSLKAQLDIDRREVRRIAEEMGDWATSAGLESDEWDLDLDTLRVESIDGTVY